jgi:hypothetical protein
MTARLAELLARLDVAERAYFSTVEAQSLAEYHALRERWIEASLDLAIYVSANRDLFEQRRAA